MGFEQDCISRLCSPTTSIYGCTCRAVTRAVDDILGAHAALRTILPDWAGYRQLVRIYILVSSPARHDEVQVTRELSDIVQIFIDQVGSLGKDKELAVLITLRDTDNSSEIIVVLQVAPDMPSPNAVKLDMCLNLIEVFISVKFQQRRVIGSLSLALPITAAIPHIVASLAAHCASTSTVCDRNQTYRRYGSHFSVAVTNTDMQVVSIRDCLSHLQHLLDPLRHGLFLEFYILVLASEFCV